MLSCKIQHPSNYVLGSCCWNFVCGVAGQLKYWTKVWTHHQKFGTFCGQSCPPHDFWLAPSQLWFLWAGASNGLLLRDFSFAVFIAVFDCAALLHALIYNKRCWAVLGFNVFINHLYKQASDNLWLDRLAWYLNLVLCGSDWPLEGLRMGQPLQSCSCTHQ